MITTYVNAKHSASYSIIFHITNMLCQYGRWINILRIQFTFIELMKEDISLLLYVKLSNNHTQFVLISFAPKNNKQTDKAIFN